MDYFYSATRRKYFSIYDREFTLLLCKNCSEPHTKSNFLSISSRKKKEISGISEAKINFFTYLSSQLK